MLLTAEINGSLNSENHLNGTAAEVGDDEANFTIPGDTTLVMVCFKGADGYATHDGENVDPSSGDGTFCADGDSVPFFDGFLKSPSVRFAIGSSSAVSYTIRCYRG